MDNNIIEPGTWKLLEGTDLIYSMGKNGTLGTHIATIAYNDKATAKFICNAVNNYDSLLEALKKVELFYNETDKNGFIHGTTPEFRNTVEEAIKKAEQKK